MRMTEQTPPPLDQAPRLSQVFSAFLRLGATAFGGPAMVPYIGAMAVEKRQWLSRQSFKEGVAVAQTIPGATAMQVAAYVGLRARGVAGAAAAYVGFGLPAFVFMVVLSAIYGVTHTSPLSQSIFQGLQAIVVAIVARAAFTFGSNTLKAWPDAVIGLAAAVYLALGGNPMLAIALGAAAGLLLYRGGAGGGEAPDAPEPVRPTGRAVAGIVVAAALLLAALFVLDRRLFDLATLMLRIDLFAFGGGFGSVPIMLHEVVEVKRWLSTAVFMDGIAMGQVTPGPIVITATFIGHQLAGLLGALSASLFIFLPSFVLLTFTVPHFDRVKHNPRVRSAIRGILSAFVGLLLAVTLKFALATPWSPVSALLAVAAFVALMLKAEVPWVVVPGALLSALLLR